MRNPSADVTPHDPIDAIAAQPWRYELFQALRWIEATHAELPRLGTARRPADEPLRVGQSTDMGFAASSLAQVKRDGPGGRPRIEQRILGLFGPNGPLPLHLTAYARDRQMHRGDETFARFADVFHHRLLLLFYRAWAQAQPTVSLDRAGEDRFADYVGSLLGVGDAAWRERSAAPDHARLAFSGLFARQARNADGLARVLSGFLGTEVRVEQFVGRWMPLPASERSRLGRAGPERAPASARLGRNAVLGQSVFDRQHHFRLHIGPLELEAFEKLLPVGSALPAIDALVKQYVGLEFGWDLHLLLKPAERPACRPGTYGRLGWTTWLGGRSRGGPESVALDPSPLLS